MSVHVRGRSPSLPTGEDAADAGVEAAGGLRIPLAHLLKKSAPIDMAGSVQRTPSETKKPAGPAWGAGGGPEGASPPTSGIHPSLRSIQVRPLCFFRTVRPLPCLGLGCRRFAEPVASSTRQGRGTSNSALYRRARVTLSQVVGICKSRVHCKLFKVLLCRQQRARKLKWVCTCAGGAGAAAREHEPQLGHCGGLPGLPRWRPCHVLLVRRRAASHWL